MKRLRIVVCEPDKAAEVRTVNDSDAFLEIVGATIMPATPAEPYLEHFPLEDGVVVVANDCYNLYDPPLPLNKRLALTMDLRGTFLVVRVDREGEYRGLTEVEAERWAQELSIGAQ